MKRTMTGMIIFLLLAALFISSAFATGLTGEIWTNRPYRFLGIPYGYYCTAAKNTSTDYADPWAYAASYINGVAVSVDTQTGNNTAVANTGFNRPDSGLGMYGEGPYDYQTGEGDYIWEYFDASDYPLF